MINFPSDDVHSYQNIIKIFLLFVFQQETIPFQSKLEDSYGWKPEQKPADENHMPLPTSFFSYQPVQPVSSVEAKDKKSVPTATNMESKPTPSTSQYSSLNGTVEHSLKDNKTRLPPTKSPFMTLLQKNRGKNY